MFANVYCWSLALFFVAAGAAKLMRSKETLVAANGAWANDFSRRAIKGIGALEVVSAVTLAAACLIARPALALLACSILGMVMVGAVITHLKRVEYKQSAFAMAVGIAVVGGIVLILRSVVPLTGLIRGMQ